MVTHKLRSFLTILGVVIGVAAVIILMSVGRGTEAMILKNFSNLGANVITVRPGSSTSGGIRGGFGSASTLTLEDAQAIEASVSNINGVAPTSQTGMQVVAGNQNMHGHDHRYYSRSTWISIIFRFRKGILSPRMSMTGI